MCVKKSVKMNSYEVLLYDNVYVISHKNLLFPVVFLRKKTKKKE
jgi:hypothetical protein